MKNYLTKENGLDHIKILDSVGCMFNTSMGTVIPMMEDGSFDVDNPLVLPEGSKVKVLIAGNDVMHSFFVPSLAVQEYTVPGKLNEVWMDIPKGEKTYYGQCNQICGINHSYMPIVIKVLTKENYETWLKKAGTEFALVEPSRKENLVLAEVKNQKEK